MTDFGFTIENDDGGVLLNDYDDFFRYLGEGTTPTISNTADMGLFSYAFPATRVTFPEAVPPGEPIIVAVQLSQVGLGYPIMEFDGSGNKVSCTFVAEKGTEGASGVNYKLFVRYGWNPVASLPTNYGIRIQDANGNLLYDSRVPELKFFDAVGPFSELFDDTGGFIEEGQTHAGKANAFYDIGGVQHSLQVRAYPLGDGDRGTYLNWATYKQTSSSSLYRYGHTIDLGYPGPDDGTKTYANSVASKALIVDDNLYY